LNFGCTYANVGGVADSLGVGELSRQRRDGLHLVVEDLLLVLGCVVGRVDLLVDSLNAAL
jgi:hypothetical protein